MEWSALVFINNRFSCLKSIPLGCVQGSVLSPFLFNIYTSQLPKVLNEDFVCSYADDTYVAISCNKNKIQDGIKRLEYIIKEHFLWLESIGMVYNPLKTEFMVFGETGVGKLSLEINGERILQSDKINILGVVFQSNLKWDSHIKNIINQSNSMIYAFVFFWVQAKLLFMCWGVNSRN